MVCKGNIVNLEIPFNNLIQIEYKLDFPSECELKKNLFTLNLYHAFYREKKIKCYERIFISTGLKIKTLLPIRLNVFSIPNDVMKKGLMVPNLNYITQPNQQEELQILLWNFDVDDYILKPFDKIAEVSFEILEEISEY